MKFVKYPYVTCVIIALAWLVAAIFAGNSSSIDMHVHDTYYILYMKSAVIAAGLYFLLLAVLYFISGRYMFSRGLAKVHIYGSMAALLLAVLAGGYAGTMFGIQGSNKNTYLAYEVTVWLVLIFLLLQLLYPYNLVRGILNSQNKSKR